MSSPVDPDGLPRARVTVVLLALLVFVPAATALIPARAEGIGPGSHLLIRMGNQEFGCTAGWIFRDSAGSFYLSTAGHCLLSPFATATHGPGADDPGNAVVRVCVSFCTFGGETGFFLPGNTVTLGSVAYARQFSFGGMVGNDFGLIRIPPALEPLMRPGLPEFGQATSVRDLRIGDDACYYGAGLVTGETYLTMSRHGFGLGTLGTSWRLAGLSTEGDSGAAVATCGPGERAEAAVGILTHLSGGTVTGTTMGRAQQMAREAGLVIVPVL